MRFGGQISSRVTKIDFLVIPYNGLSFRIKIVDKLKITFFKYQVPCIKLNIIEKYKLNSECAMVFFKLVEQDTLKFLQQDIHCSGENSWKLQEYLKVPK